MLSLLHHKLVTWDCRWPPNMCWISVVSCVLGGTAFSPPNSSRHTDCIMSIANLQKEIFIKICFWTWPITDYITLNTVAENVYQTSSKKLIKFTLWKETYLINSWASSCLPYPRLPPILGNRESMLIGEKGCWLRLARSTWCWNSQRKHQPFRLPEGREEKVHNIKNVPIIQKKR